MNSCKANTDRKDDWKDKKDDIYGREQEDFPCSAVSGDFQSHRIRGVRVAARIQCLSEVHEGV